ncbi:hypothetical protein CC78DRAFT_535605 [Lojkania enalia]|uniref:Uncharacterized protein n=1 Tax=Lojkania enalia TaxID=147567 RepID=A0A9P4N0M2_9PLEO|nr:hypothetical protein CC78DRAFT_535605 [Didymosphaeria enalia]
MPRPKRTKVGSTTTRIAKHPIAAKPIPEPQKGKKTSDIIDSFSDDSDGLVFKSSRIRERMPWEPKPQNGVDLTMTGGLPLEDKDTGKQQSKEASPRAVIISSRYRTPSSNASRKTQSGIRSAKSKTNNYSPAQSRLDNSKSHDTSSRLDDSLDLSFGSLDSESPARGIRPPSIMKVGGTPAHETSILALTNFRRRSRQPSLLRMVHQTTDMEDNDLDDLDDLDDFHPADESTPLHLQKGGSREDAIDNSGLSLYSASSQRKKRKIPPPVIQVPRSSPPFDPPSGADVEDSQRSLSPSLSDNIIESQEVGTEEEVPVDPEIMSETMAPPRSSSPPADNVEDSPEPTKRRRTQRQLQKADDHPGLEDEELDSKPKSKTRLKVKTHAISTAKLQALLPRRRVNLPKEQDEYDLQTSDDNTTPPDSDQDELQLPLPRRAPAFRKTMSLKTNRNTRKGRKPALAMQTTKKITRTYGARRTSSDKENDSTLAGEEASEDTESTIAPVVPLSKSNLAAIANKFKEVDAWEMEFESVDMPGDSSSPWR